MRKKILLPLLLLSGFSFNEAMAQCTATLSSVGDCYPFTLTASANFGMDSIIWKKNGTTVQIYSATASNGVIVAGGNGSGAAANQFNIPTGLHVMPDGTVYVSDMLNNRVQKWAPGATTGVTVAGGNGNGTAANQLKFPGDVFVTSNGDVYVSDGMNNRVQKWTPGATTGVTVAGGNGSGSAANQLAFPGGIFVKNGDVYIIDCDNSRIQKWAAGATTGVTVAGGNGYGPALNQVGAPSLAGSIYVDANNNIYFTEYGYDRVKKWDYNATSGTIVAGGNGQGAGANQLHRPTGVIVDNAGGVYVAEETNNRVQYWPANATTGTTVIGGNGAGPALNQLNNPVDLMKFNDTVFVCETDNRRVTRFVLGTNSSPTYTVTSPGVYQAIVKNATCADTVEMTFDFPTEILINPAGPIHLCDGETEVLTATNHPTITYQWLKNGFNTGANANTLTINETGIYKVITNVNGNCIDTTDAVTASFYDLPVPVITNTNGVLTTGTFSTYQWYRNTVLIPGATTNTYTTTQSGTYSVTVTNENDCEGTSVNVEVTDGVGTKDLSIFDDVKIYPNPTNDVLFLNFPKTIAATDIEIINLQGQVVLTQVANPTADPVKVDLSNIASGVYFLKINTKESSKTFRITKH